MPRVELASWPTPIEAAPRLARAIGLGPADLWVKRDDLSALGGGGNKVRKLEYLCGAALSNGADTLLTSGAAQSNHARLTAAAGARLGLEVHLVLGGSAPASPSGNVLLDRLLGAHLHWAGETTVGEPGTAGLADAVELRAEQLRAAGRVVEVIPYGGSTAVSAQGYLDCARELLEQLPALEQVVVAVGSGGTLAGLVHGLGSARVLGVDTGALADPHGSVLELLEGLRELRPDAPRTEQPRIDASQVGDGYAVLSEQAAQALELAARSEGLLLDPVYTARALAGLRAAVERGELRRGAPTVLLHTGGLPGLFGHADLAKLWSGAENPDELR